MIKYGCRQEGAQQALVQVSDLRCTIISALFWNHGASLDYRWDHQIPILNFDFRGNEIKLSEVSQPHKPLPFFFLTNLISSCLLFQWEKVISGDHNGSNVSAHNCVCQKEQKTDVNAKFRKPCRQPREKCFKGRRRKVSAGSFQHRSYGRNKITSAGHWLSDLHVSNTWPSERKKHQQRKK